MTTGGCGQWFEKLTRTVPRQSHELKLQRLRTLAQQGDTKLLESLKLLFKTATKMIYARRMTALGSR
jgi:hypothetical protein